MISKEQAFEIVKTELGTLYEYEIEVLDGAKHKASIYGDFDWENLWYVRILKIDKVPILESSDIVLIDKSTGEIVFSGPAADEG